MRKIIALIIIALLILSTFSMLFKVSEVEAFQSPQKQIYIYYDPRYPNCWFSSMDSLVLRDYLTTVFTQYGISYTLVDADVLRTVLLRLDIAEETIVIMTQDVAPDTIWDGSSDGSVVERWLEAGGTMVWTADWEFFYVGHSDGSKDMYVYGPMYVYDREVFPLRLASPDPRYDFIATASPTSLGRKYMPSLQQLATKRPAQKSLIQDLYYEAYGSVVVGDQEYFDPVLFKAGSDAKGFFVKVGMAWGPLISPYYRGAMISELILNRFFGLSMQVGIFLSSWLINPVTIDGKITTTTEWSDTISYDVSLNRAWGWPYKQVDFTDTIVARYWFKNDATWLYLLVRVAWPAGETDVNDLAAITLFWGQYLPPWENSDLSFVTFGDLAWDAYGWDEARWYSDTEASPPGQNNVQGAASHDGTYYWFEFRKALNSGDGYDWSLSPGDVVGNINAPVETPHLMVSIYDASIASAYERYISLDLSAPPVAPDLTVSKPRPIQVIWDSDLNDDGKIDLVARKMTAVLATVTISGSLEKQEVIDVKWTYDGLEFVYSYTVSELLEKQGRVEFYLDAPEIVGNYKITIKVDPYNKISESNEGNNEEFVEVTVRDTIGLHIVYIPVIHLGLLSAYRETVSKSGVFIKATYPISEEEFTNQRIDVPYVPTGASYIPFVGLLYDAVRLYVMGWLASLGKATDVVGVVPEFYFVYHLVDTGTTGLNPPGPGAVFVKERNWKTLAHEIGHSYGLPVNLPPGIREEYNLFPEGRSATGFWVDEGLVRSDINNDGSIGYIDGGCFMGGSARKNSFLYYSGRPVWVDDDCYRYLFNKFKTSVNDPEEVILVNGLIFKNGTIQLGTWYRLKEGVVSNIPSGNYLMRLLDSDGRIIVETKFDAPFYMHVDETVGVVDTEVTSFAFSMPFDSATSRIQLVYNGVVLAERVVTPNPPTVQVTYPNGGEIWGGLATHTITWEAFDPDGDKITYAVMYSDDGGISWQPLALDLTDTKYFWDTNNLPTGSNYLIRVIASDGINTGTDDSDSTFTILAGWTHATIDLNPDTLNLKSKGEQVTVYIELPEGYDVANINISTIMLNGTVPALAKPIQVGDYDGDGIPDLMVKFERKAVQALFKGLPVPKKYLMVITGMVSDVPFVGTDTIKIISP